MAKSTSIKDAIKSFEEKKGVVATECEKVSQAHNYAGHVAKPLQTPRQDNVGAWCARAPTALGLPLISWAYNQLRFTDQSCAWRSVGPG